MKLYKIWYLRSLLLSDWSIQLSWKRYTPDNCHNRHNRRWCTFFKPAYLFPQRTQNGLLLRKFIQRVKTQICAFFVRKILDAPSRILNVTNIISQCHRYQLHQKIYSVRQTNHQTPSTPNKTPNTPNKTPGTPNKTPSTPNKTPRMPNKTPNTPNKTPNMPNKTPGTPNKTPSTLISWNIWMWIWI